MNKELTITNEDIELLKEMKNNCLKSDIYNDEKRLLKANAITKFLLLQQENTQLKEQTQELRSWLKNFADYSDCIKIISVLNKLNELEGKNE